MSSKLNFRSDNVNYKELLKKREERRKKQQSNKNPFVLSVPQTNQEVYKSLYKFDVETELEEYSLPLGENETIIEEDKKLDQSRSPKSKMGSEYRGGEEEIFENEESQIEQNYEDLPEEQMVTYEQIVKDLYSEKKKQVVKTIQKADFVDQDVWNHLISIRSGQDAISFFAKYGNTTPIKFINCVRDDSHPPESFRPYDLKTINRTNENQKNVTLDEYYTISAHGIVHVFTDKGKKNRKGDTSTEVISLSDWMLESTQFNIITNIQFFKNYVITKIFNIWRANVNYRQFCKTRKKLVHDGFICKPAFANHLRDVNEMMYELQNIKTIPGTISMARTWEIDDLKHELKKTRDESLQNYETIIEKVNGQCEIVCKEVIERTKIKDQTEIEEGRFGQQVKQKPMNEIRKENEERAYLLDRAIKDKEKLKQFVRLVDYIVEETLYETNFLSMKILQEEMYKEGRKLGMFSITVQFDTHDMLWSPTEDDIKNILISILEEMIKCVNDTTRVIEKLDNYVKILNTDQKCNLGKMITESVKYLAIRDGIEEKLSKDFKLGKDHVNQNFQKCRPIHDMFTKQQNQEDILGEDPKMDTIRQKINEFNQWERDLSEFIKDKPAGVLQVEGKGIKQKLSKFVKDKLQQIQQELLNLMRKKTNKTKDDLSKFNQNLEKTPTTLKEYAEYIEQLNEIEEVTKDSKMEKRKVEIEEMHVELKQKFEGNKIETDDVLKLEDIQIKYAGLVKQIEEAKNIKNNKKEEMIKKTEQEIDALKQKITNVATQINQGVLVDENTNPAEALQKLNEIQTKQIDKYKKQDQTFVKYQKLMETQVSPNRELEDLEQKFKDRKMLWEHSDKFQQCHEKWFTGNFQELESEAVEKQMKTFEQGVMQLQLNIHNLNKDGKDKVLESHAIKIQEVTKLMPVISALGNKALQPKHWKKIFEKLGDPNWQSGTTFTLNELIVKNAEEKIDDLEEISAKATGEAGIQEQIDEIQKKWQELNFIVKPYRDYKDKFIIGSIEEIVQALDDHQLKVQTMLGTRFVAEIFDLVDGWRNKLNLISDIMDEWLTCQRQWMYLENIFSAEDIQKQLPQETAKFQQVDKFWRETMLKTNKRPLVADCCDKEELLKKFKNNNAVLEDIQKCLENYLETKRMAFPRFYFLSNDELLEILSQTRNPHAVQDHLRKCFDNINRIQFTEEDESKEIIGMQSAEPEVMPEKVPFSGSVMAEGAVEHWLFRIQEMMVQSLYDIAKKCLAEYPESGLERRDWLFSYPAQIILVIDQIQWTSDSTISINKQSQGDKKALKNQYDFMIKLINSSVSIVQSNLNTLERTLMGALIVLDVHCRDVSGQLFKQNVQNINDFEWSKQLRYYWEDDVDDVVSRQTNTYFKYAYEYLGNGPRLVITPLTDKCYITLTGAKHLQYGGAPAGPAGTGKTETTKDLAKALAVQCVVFNCSDGLDFRTMGRFFAGLSQGGAWACFDEFNRIDIEVLSVIAQQILTIQNAIRAQVDTFEFEGRQIVCNNRFGVYITMNPGYAGRTELPDNLKALFRPVAMMIPDYGMIAEIILFSEGFETAQKLSKKMVKLYSLSSEQLSKQDHYDFGMRAVKSVLVMAGALRRKDPSVSEDIVLIRAMRDSNIPKFLEHDLPLFQGIIEDLFPGVQVPFTSYGNLQNAIEHQLDLLNYQKPPKFITKIIQLIETMIVRHGVMVVGVAATGKSTNIDILSKALHQLNQEGSTDFWHKFVKVEKLNPKAVTMNELFGYTNVMTNEWTDGIAAAIIRNNVNEGGENKKWIVFDGPVDALWIENMNTVLDDNKMLCLNNGQRIKLPVTFEMIFEVNDLAVASPATVSRCGMVYMEPAHLGWIPLIETWSIKFIEENTPKDEKTPQYLTDMVANVQEFFKDKLKWLRENCKETIASVDNNLVSSCLNLINVLWEQMKAEYPNLNTIKPSDAKELCAMVYIFAFIWSAGANLHDSSRKQFSIEIKQNIFRYFNGFPYQDEVYDFYPNFKEKKFMKWDDLNIAYKYDKNASYFSILVPTSDTVKYKYMLDQLVCNGHNMLLCGETGVGKSVIINDYIYGLSQEKYEFTSLNFSAQTSSSNLQDLFLDKLQKIKKGVIGPPPGKKVVVFIDDINMPALETYGAQPVNELLRQIIDHGGFYELKKLIFIKIQDIVFVAACATPGGGRNQVTPRLFRHFNMFWNPDLSKKSMTDIFTAILKGFLGESPHKAQVEKLSSPIVKATIDMYLIITKELLPTPTKSHYTFNLRDISKVFQGVLMGSYDNLKEKESVINLWIHECSRVFSDRLVDEDDRAWFNQQMLTQVQGLKLDIEYTIEEFSTLIFGDYNNQYKEYIQIDNPEGSLPQKFNEYLLHYNSQNAKQMNLVFFMDAIKHISKICRVLRQPRGNALLIGVGGSGRQSLTRLATFIRKFECFSIEITKSYKEAQWKDDLKKLLKISGAKNIGQTFLFSDTQIQQESFLEDINNVLNTGEISNLFGVEDYEEILGDLRPIAKEKKLDQGRDNLLKMFVSNVRENLHIVLAFSPVGEKLRNRCRMFPSLVNCCAIDWFDRWPEQALYSVALKEYKAQERLGIGEFVEQLSRLSMKIHQDVINKSDEFYEELRRRNYVTPTSYLELMKLYVEMMRVQKNTLPLKISKYTVGLETLKQTNADVALKKEQINEMQPKLKISAEENTKLVAELKIQNAQAAETAAICGKEKEEAQVIRDDVNQQKESCEADLAAALPTLQKAQKAVQNINPKDLQELKSFKSPPEMVKIVLEAVCLILGEKEDWPTAQKQLGKMNFINILLEFNVNSVPEKRWNKFRNNFLKLENFTEENVKKVSQAAVALLSWTVASEKFYKVTKEVAPKKKKLAEAEATLSVVEGQLAEKEAALKEVQDKVADLQREFDISTKKAATLKDQLRIAEEQLNRAEKLVHLLGGEAVRWQESAELLQQDLTNLTGNIILAAASVAYLGPFNAPYRQKMIEKWTKDCKNAEIPVSQNFNLARILVEEVTIREWQENGLPADTLSVANAIFITNARRWPLIIDPQGQANKWIKQLKADSNIQVTKLTEPNFLRTLENSIRFGSPVLLENVEEILDPALEPILLKQTTKKGPQLVLQLGDQEIPYSLEFQFFMTSKLPNPHYIPEIAIKTTIINFTVTPQGLEDQLLVEVVRHERVELEEKRIQLILEISQSKRQLQDLEDKILRQIGEAQGRILEDEDIVATLDTSKITSETINKRLEASKITSEEINTTRELYRGIARRGSILYFVIASLSNIDPMYQYSLDFFIQLFKIRLEKSENPEGLDARLEVLINDITKNFYKNICRGLFEKDKLLYSFLICTNIKITNKEISSREWLFFQRGALTLPELEEGEENEIPSFIGEKMYLTLLAMSKEHANFSELMTCVKDKDYHDQWIDIQQAKDPWKCVLPGVLEQKLTLFQKLLLLKQFREEKLIWMIKLYVQDSLGKFFIESPPFNLNDAFEDSTSITPIIFVLSAGADPMAYLQQLAKEKEFDTKFKSLSLGQGQGDKAKEFIKSGRRNGDWVCLQNCHLAVSWMTELERIQEQQVEADTHPDYRIWLTSMPSTKFPVPVLQSGIKLTNEPPKGLKANIKGTFAEIKEEDYNNSCTKAFEFKKLLFSLAFFHAIILERRKFGAIGWNIAYDWMQSDFMTCKMQLVMYLNEQPDIPWKTLNYLIAEINYGGRVTDDKDVRLITAQLAKYFNPNIMGEHYEFSSSGLYKSVTELDLDQVINYIDNFPLEDDPEVFGLHVNANITFQNKTVREFMDTLLSGQPRSSTKGAQKPEDMVQQMAEKMLKEVPALIPSYQGEDLNSLQIFRSQEVVQFNRLIKQIKKTLNDLILAIQGKVVMSLELEKMFNSFLIKQVPDLWSKVAYPSLKPLGSWQEDFLARIDFFNQWVDKDVVPSYWVSSMFFPQGFMTAALQVYARSYHIAIDTLIFRTEIKSMTPDQCTESPEKGVHIHGLFLEGCRWDMEKMCLGESLPNILFEPMPVIWLEPIQIEEYKQIGYKCPLYKTSTRKGTLSTTGHSTNFVMYLDLKSIIEQEHWIRRGVALLMQLDD